MKVSRRYVFVSAIIATVLGLILLNVKVLYLKPLSAESILLLKDSQTINSITTLSQSGGNCFNNPSSDNPGKSTIVFQDPTPIDSFSIFFPGNYHAISSYTPREFEVRYQSPDSESNITRITNYQENYYQHKFPETTSVSEIEISFLQSNFPGSIRSDTVCYKDFRIYKNTDVSLAHYLGYQVRSVTKSMTGYWLYYALFVVALLVPGLSFADSLLKNIITAKNKSLLIPFGFVVTIVYLSICSAISYLTKSSLPYILIPVYLIYGLISFYRYRYYRLFSLTQITIILTSLLITFLIVGRRDLIFNYPYFGSRLDEMTPVPSQGYVSYDADSIMPWNLGKFIHRQLSPSDPLTPETLGPNATLFDRTPILPLISASIMPFLGEGHFPYQRLLETLVAIYALTIYLITYSLTNKRGIAFITTFLLFANTQLSWLSFNVELFYKYFAAIPVFLASYLSLRKSPPNINLIIILLAVGFLIHPYVTFLSPAIYILAISRYKNNHYKAIAKSLPIMIIYLIIALVWIKLPSIISHNPSSRTESIYLNEISQYQGNIIQNKFVNFGQLFIPNFLRHADTVGTLPINSPILRFQILRYSLLSVITPIFFIFLVSVFLFPNIRSKLTSHLTILATSPLIIYWLLYLNKYNHFANYGGAYFLIYPYSVPLFIMAITKAMSQQRNQIVKTFLITTYILTMIVNFYFLNDARYTSIHHLNPTIDRFNFALPIVFAATQLIVLIVSYVI